MAIEEILLRFAGIPAICGIIGAFAFGLLLSKRPYVIILGFIAGALVGLGLGQI